MYLEDGNLIIKVRDDPEPVALEPREQAESSPDSFCIQESNRPSWAPTAAPINSELLRKRIEPWLTALFQSEHLSLLVGSGLTHAVHGIAHEHTLPGMQAINFGGFANTIASSAKSLAHSGGRNEGNFEDQLRAASELLNGLEAYNAVVPDGMQPIPCVTELRDEIANAIGQFAESILQAEASLTEASDSAQANAFSYLVRFLLSFASRSPTRERLEIFTTNYDRYLEFGADLAGLRIIDRFVGSVAPVFRASRLALDFHYNPPGLTDEPRHLEGVVRLSKLHGSIDWMDARGVIRRYSVPFGASSWKPYLPSAKSGGHNAEQLMVYPNASKDQETLYYPYIELFRDFAQAICRPNSALVCYGYSFGDAHINRIIADMLTIPSTHLVIIAHGDPLNRIMDSYYRFARPAQTSLLLGPDFGSLQSLVDTYLPKASLDRITSRLAAILNQRSLVSELDTTVAGPDATNGHEERDSRDF